MSSFEELGSPFKEVGEDFTALHAKDMMYEEVVRTVGTARQLWEQKFKAFLKRRLYIACQNRDGNIEDFFKFENQPWPPSPSQVGELREGTKADLVKCFSDASSQTLEQLSVDTIILDGAFAVQMLQLIAASTFKEYLTPCLRLTSWGS